jgi:hypothetical protein
VNVDYQAPKDLGDVPINMVLQSLRTKLAMPDLTLKAQRIIPPKAAKSSKAVQRRAKSKSSLKR